MLGYFSLPTLEDPVQLSEELWIPEGNREEIRLSVNGLIGTVGLIRGPRFLRSEPLCRCLGWQVSAQRQRRFTTTVFPVHPPYLSPRAERLLLGYLQLFI